MNVYDRELEKSWSISFSLFSKHLYDELIAETYRWLSLCQGNLQDDGAAIVIRVSNPERLVNWVPNNENSLLHTHMAQSQANPGGAREGPGGWADGGQMENQARGHFVYFLSESGVYLYIFRSWLIVTVQIRGVFVYIRIAINSYIPNQRVFIFGSQLIIVIEPGVFCKVCALTGGHICWPRRRASLHSNLPYPLAQPLPIWAKATQE